MAKRIKIKRPKKRLTAADKYAEIPVRRSSTDKLKDSFLEDTGGKLTIAEEWSPLDKE